MIVRAAKQIFKVHLQNGKWCVVVIGGCSVFAFCCCEMIKKLCAVRLACPYVWRLNLSLTSSLSFLENAFRGRESFLELFLGKWEAISCSSRDCLMKWRLFMFCVVLCYFQDGLSWTHLGPVVQSLIWLMLSQQTAWIYAKSNPLHSFSTKFRDASILVENPSHIGKQIGWKVSAVKLLWLIGLRTARPWTSADWLLCFSSIISSGKQVYQLSVDEGNGRRERDKSWRFERSPFVRATDSLTKGEPSRRQLFSLSRRH